MRTYHPIIEMFIARMKQFYREPEAIFWTYGFPLAMTIGLGIAFRSRPPERVRVDVLDGPSAADVARVLAAASEFEVQTNPSDQAGRRLRTGKCDVTVEHGPDGLVYRFDPTRPESALARAKVDAALQFSERSKPVASRDQIVTEPGARYIDFLVPGLLGMNLLGGGIWGIGFTTIDLRIRKLLKRYVATPMRRSDFLLALVAGRMLFAIPELALILLAGVLLFGVTIAGSLLAVTTVAILGALVFTGMGLLVACRADRMESAVGLGNMVTLPMWLLSGVFFSSERFPAITQPFVQALPLTQLNNALRAVILDGSSLASQWLPLLILVAWGGASFVLALRWFRWT